MWMNWTGIGVSLLALFALLIACLIVDWTLRPQAVSSAKEPSRILLSPSKDSLGITVGRSALGIKFDTLTLGADDDSSLITLKGSDARHLPMQNAPLYEFAIGQDSVFLGEFGEIISVPLNTSRNEFFVSDKLRSVFNDLTDVLPTSGNAFWRTLLPNDATRPLIVINPTFGGRDVGDISPKGFTESDLMLLAALDLQSEFKKRGVAAALTRSSDEYVSSEGRIGTLWGNRAYLFVTLETATYTSPNGVGVYAGFLDPEETPNARWIQPERTKIWGQLYSDKINASFRAADLASNLEPDQSVELEATGIAPSLLITLGDLGKSSDEFRLSNRTSREAMMSILADAIVGEFNDLKVDIGHGVFVLDDDGQFLIPKTG